MYLPRFLAVVALLAASVEGFALVPRTMTRQSSLNMVADDAKVVLVTGSSRGLGKAIALDIGKAGQKVVINYVSDSSKESAEEVVKEIKAAGGDAVAIQADSKLILFRKWKWRLFDNHVGIVQQSNNDFFLYVYQVPSPMISRSCSTSLSKHLALLMFSSTMLELPVTDLSCEWSLNNGNKLLTLTCLEYSTAPKPSSSSLPRSERGVLSTSRQWSVKLETRDKPTMRLPKEELLEWAWPMPKNLPREESR